MSAAASQSSSGPTWRTGSKEPEAAGIVKMVRGDDGVEAFRQLNNRVDPHTDLTKWHRLKAIHKFPGQSGVKKNVDVPAVCFAKFEDLLLKHYEDYESEALSDDLKKEALKELIPPALGQSVKDVIMFRNTNVVTLSAAQVKIDCGTQCGRRAGPGHPQAESREQAPQPPPSQEAEWSKAEWANSLGYGPQQGAIGKNGKGKGKDEKGKGKGKDWSKGGQAGAGAGKGERPIGACSFCLDFGHHYRACPARLGVEGAAQAQKEYAAKGGGDWPKGKVKGKGKFGNAKSGSNYKLGNGRSGPNYKVWNVALFREFGIQTCLISRSWKVMFSKICLQTVALILSKD